MHFAPYDRAMLDAHSLATVADLLVLHADDQVPRCSTTIAIPTLKSKKTGMTPQIFKSLHRYLLVVRFRYLLGQTDGQTDKQTGRWQHC